MDLQLRLPADLAATVSRAHDRALSERWASRIWERDTSLWTADPEVAALVGARLGWLDAPVAFRDEVAELTAFGQGVAQEGYTDALVCGMGGSSLAPEVLAAVLPRAATGLRVRVLDSTDPIAVLAVDRDLDPAGLLRIMATKSGTTTETLAFLAHFWDREIHRVGHFPRRKAGNGFVAVTDPGRPLAAIPHSDVFRETFLNPHDVGGRYSALTYVGLVPAALAGLDLDALLEDARLMGQACLDDVPANPGLHLGVAIGALARAGRDKLTFVIEPDLAPLGAWLEQLIAESTGKSGRGVVPVDGEPLGDAATYRADRAFVRLGRASATEWRAATDGALEALAAAGHPLIDIPIADPAWVGGEFFRWEFATAVAGIVLEVNPFDEPNVTESKQNTAAVLERAHHEGRLPVGAPLAQESGLLAYGPPEAAAGGQPSLTSLLRWLLAEPPAGAYVGICAFLAPSPSRQAALRALQALVREKTRCATTMGFGPRFLHSTGQLHKGGPAVGRFLQLVAQHPEDLAIPGRHESFGTLIDAQALGDEASLAAHGLPCLRIDLGPDPDTTLAILHDAVAQALG